MQVKFDIKYERSRKKIAKRIDIQKIQQIETLFVSDASHYKLELKSIVCRRDTNKKSIRVLGNEGFSINFFLRPGNSLSIAAVFWKALKEWEKLNSTIRVHFKKKLKERLENPIVQKDKLSGYENLRVVNNYVIIAYIIV